MKTEAEIESKITELTRQVGDADREAEDCTVGGNAYMIVGLRAVRADTTREALYWVMGRRG